MSFPQNMCFLEKMFLPIVFQTNVQILHNCTINSGKKFYLRNKRNQIPGFAISLVSLRFRYKRNISELSYICNAKQFEGERNERHRDWVVAFYFLCCIEGIVFIWITTIRTFDKERWLVANEIVPYFISAIFPNMSRIKVCAPVPRTGYFLCQNCNMQKKVITKLTQADKKATIPLYESGVCAVF